MNISITQANQNDKQISKSIKRFFTRFHISSALKAANAYKKKGIPARLCHFIKSKSSKNIVFINVFGRLIQNNTTYVNVPKRS